MQTVLSDNAMREALELKLALVLDMEIFMSTTYLFECDGLIVLKAYDVVESFRKCGRSLQVQATLPITRRPYYVHAPSLQKERSFVSSGEKLTRQAGRA